MNPTSAAGRACRTATFCLFAMMLVAPGGASQADPPVEIDIFDHSVATFEILMPDGTVERVTATGSSTQAVYFEGAGEGTANDDDGDLREEVQTELLDFILVGVSPIFGPVSFSLHPTIPSVGEIEETANSTAGLLDVPPFGAPGSTADSFIDMRLVIQLGGQTFYTDGPQRFRSVITHKPPATGDLYGSLEDVSLLDVTGQPTGISFGSCSYQPNPSIEIDVFDHSRGTFEIVMPDGTVETITATGPATQTVYFEGTGEGTANDDDGDIREEVPTRMVEFNLLGLSPILGPVSFSLHPTLPSHGEIEETTDSTPGLLDVPPFGAPGSTADSVINLLLEVQFQALAQPFYTRQPQHFHSRITHKPPAAGDLYETFDTVSLDDSSGQETGFSLGSCRFQPNPSVEIDVFNDALGTFEIGMPDGTVEVVTATGPATQAVYFEGAAEGAALDDDFDNREEVQIEWLELNLVGESPILGPVSFSLHPTVPAFGEIEETTDSTPGLLDVPPFGAPGSTADSFIRMYLVVRLGGQTFYTDGPEYLNARITHKPPAAGDLYEALVDVSLVDVTGQPTGFYLGSSSLLPNPQGPDGDADGTPDAEDNCPTIPNSDQLDTDTDEIGDACDNCRKLANAGPCPAGRACTGDQLDDDQDGIGNLCDGDFTEGLGDGFCNVSDLLRFLDAFGKSVGASTCPEPSAVGSPTGICARYDLTGEGAVVNVSDLLVMIDAKMFGVSVSEQGCAQDDTGVVRCPLP